MRTHTRTHTSARGVRMVRRRDGVELEYHGPDEAEKTHTHTHTRPHMYIVSFVCPNTMEDKSEPPSCH